MFTLAALPVWLVGILVALFVLVSVMMMLIVLIQRPQGGGLSEAFGSASGSGHTAFGAKTGDALTLATIFIFIVFIGFAIGLNYVVKPPSAATAPAEVVPGPAGAIPIEGVPPASPTGATTTTPPAEQTSAPATEQPAAPAPAPATEQPAAPNP